MVRKTLLGFFSSAHSRHPPPTGRQTFCATMMDDNIDSAEAVITLWDPESTSCSTKTASLFATDRQESLRLLRSVSELQQAMLFFVSDECAASPSARSRSLVRAQTLMQAAMRRLEREFYQILSSNRDRLDPASSDDGAASSEDDDTSKHSIAAVQTAAAAASEDLRAIANAMIASGYGRECVRAYKVLRKSIVDEGLYRLGVEQSSATTNLSKLDWELLDLKIRSWLGAAPVAVRTLFAGERALCDQIFAGSDAIRESCFADIARDAAVSFLAFPEHVSKLKRSPEKLFRILDLYDAMADLWPDIESVFSSESAAGVRSQALTSLLKIAEAARGTLAEFEAAIQRDASKTMVPTGGVHPLTRYAMNYVAFLADYAVALDDIFADYPFTAPASLPEPLFEPGSTITDPRSPSSSSTVDVGPTSSVAPRIAWLVLVLLCKMDTKAEAYRDVALSYLFLANNVQYVVAKVRGGGLRQLLGDEWVARHRAKARHYAAGYERLAWSRVAAAVPSAVAEMEPAEAWERMTVFNAAFEEAVAAQSGWVVQDAGLREEVRASVTGMIVPAYRGFYEGCREALRDVGGSAGEVVRFAPEDVRNRLADLFAGLAGGGSGSGYSVGSSIGSARSG